MLEFGQVVDLLGLRNARVIGDGTQMVASCPFPANHRNGDANPSWGMNLDNGLWICHGCGAKGNLVGLLMDVLGMDRLAAYRLAYGDLGIEEAVRLMDGRKAPSRGAARTPLESDVASWAANRHPYWQSRGFTAQTQGRWMLGYDPACDRVTVPVFYGGELVGWTKRRVREDVEPKWTHFPGMRSKDVLFGYDDCTGGSCVVVEAPLSVVMLSQQGFRNAVATFGCSMSRAQADAIRAKFEDVTVFYDPDEAGAKGTAQVVGILSPFCTVSVVRGTRDDPAAMSCEENREALNSAYPGWVFA